MKCLGLIVFLMLLSSCTVRHGDRRHLYVNLSGEKMEISSDASLFEIVYANDTMLIASLLSPEHKLAAYSIGKDSASYEFLRTGRGPLEVGYANIKSRRDTLYVLSYNPGGLQKLMKISISDIRDMSRWEDIDFSNTGNMCVGRDFDIMSSSETVFTGGKFGEETLLSVLSDKDRTCTPLSFWPEDGYEGNAVPKQNMYIRGTRVFCNGDKILFACGEGRYFSLLDISSDRMTETFIYDEYPEYQVSPDGINPKRKPESRLGGIVYATDSLIFLSPLDCRMPNGRYEPEDYKGYPPYYNDRIEVYDWNGEYLYTCVTDIPFCSFYVKDRILYTLTMDRETLLSEVYQYGIPETER